MSGVCGLRVSTELKINFSVSKNYLLEKGGREEGGKGKGGRREGEGGKGERKGGKRGGGEDK